MVPWIINPIYTLYSGYNHFPLWNNPGVDFFLTGKGETFQVPRPRGRSCSCSSVLERERVFFVEEQQPTKNSNPPFLEIKENKSGVDFVITKHLLILLYHLTWMTFGVPNKPTINRQLQIARFDVFWLLCHISWSQCRYIWEGSWSLTRSALPYAKCECFYRVESI